MHNVFFQEQMHIMFYCRYLFIFINLARKPDKFNIFKGVTRNYFFMGMVVITVVLQVSNIYIYIIVQAIGKLHRTTKF